MLPDNENMLISDIEITLRGGVLGVTEHRKGKHNFSLLSLVAAHSWNGALFCQINLDVYFEESGTMTDEEMPSLDLTCFTQATFTQLPLQKFTSRALSLLSLCPLCPRTVPFSPVSWGCCWTSLPRTFLSLAFQLPTALSSFYFKMLMQQLWARWGLLILEDFNQAVLSPCFPPCGKSAVFSKIPPHCQESHPGLRDTRASHFPLW